LKLESRMERGDGLRLLAVALTLSLANFAAASAQTATPDGEKRPLQLQSRGRRRATVRRPHRPGLAVQPQRCRLGLQGGAPRALGAGDLDHRPAGSRARVALMP